jgi:hypothetical protein
VKYASVRSHSSPDLITKTQLKRFQEEATINVCLPWEIRCRFDLIAFSLPGPLFQMPDRLLCLPGWVVLCASGFLRVKFFSPFILGLLNSRCNEIVISILCPFQISARTSSNLYWLIVYFHELCTFVQLGLSFAAA